ncbi:MAG: signal recognition particle-docking protein FtsY [Candidatus Odinarchaeota archaeon]
MITLKNLRNGLKKIAKRVKEREITADNLEKTLKDFEKLFIENDVAVEVGEAISRKVISDLEGKSASRFTSWQSVVEGPIKQAVAEIMTPKMHIDILEMAKANSPLIILLLGVNGTGKTTVAAKIALLLTKNNLRPVFASCDTFRAAAQEQLKEHADKLKVKVIGGQYGADPASIAFDAIQHARARYLNAVIIDTSGRMGTNEDLMGEMKKIKRVSSPHITLLTVDALAGNDAVNQARDFNSKVGIDGCILNKMDADARGGAALSVTYATGGKPIAYIGTGQSYKDLEPFDHEAFVENLFKS